MNFVLKSYNSFDKLIKVLVWNVLPKGLGEDMIFSSMEELLIAIDQKNDSLHSKIKWRFETVNENFEPIAQTV